MGRGMMLVVILLAWSAAAMAGDLPETGRTVENEITFARMTIPLPAGRWEVAVVDEGRSASSVVGKPIASVVLARVEDKRATGFVILRANLEPAPHGWQTDGDCRRQDVLRLVAGENYDGREQDCWLLNHRRMAFSGRISAWYRKWQDWWIERLLTVPPTMLYDKHRLADRMWFVEMQVLSDPEAAGFPPATQDWSANDWHRGRVSGDARRTAHVNGLAVEAAARHDQLRRAFASR